MSNHRRHAVKTAGGFNPGGGTSSLAGYKGGPSASTPIGGQVPIVPPNRPPGSLAPARLDGSDPNAASLAGDPTLLAAQIQGQRIAGFADANYNFANNQIDSSYGYSPDGTIDMNNPYSKAALLQESARRARLGTTNSYASQGQLYSGAQQTAQDENARQYLIGDDQLRKGYASDKGNAALTRLGQYASAGSGISDADWSALLAAIKGGT